MKTLFLYLALLYSFPSLAGGIDGCNRCTNCVHPEEKAICLNTCGPNQLPSIQCQTKPMNAFLLLGQEGPPFYCVIGGHGFLCDSENCSKCVPVKR